MRIQKSFVKLSQSVLVYCSMAKDTFMNYYGSLH